MSGAIAAVPEQQPLGWQGIWRITLEGEGCGRLVRCKGQEHGSAVWRLLQLDDMTDKQLDAYEAATLDPPRVLAIAPGQPCCCANTSVHTRTTAESMKVPLSVPAASTCLHV